MARGEKPYRVYRGGRAKGKVPLERRVEDGRRRAPVPAPRPAARPPAPRRPNWLRRVGIAIGVLAVLLVVWLVASYFALSSGVQDANKRLGPAGLVPQDGLLLSHPTTILLVGTDHGPGKSRAGANRSDSIMLVRTDPGRHRLAYLSIPRDLRVDIPSRGPDKVNTAYQRGGPQLATRTIRSFTGLPVNHMVVVDFANFEKLIDAVGGITVNVPEPILSNRFDCPYSTQLRCQQWRGWRFRKGNQHMNGHRALIYSRIRENRLDPSETDITRGERQQAVLQAITGKLLSPKTLVKLPFVGPDLMAPLATDLTAGQLLQLGWLRFRASGDRTLRCRLGGSASDIGGQSFLVGSEENRNVIAMFAGLAAPQPPLPGSGPFGPGCVVGSSFKR